MSNIPAIHIWGLEGEISYNGFENHLHLNAVMSYERGKIVGKTLTLYPTIVNAVYNSPACAYFGQYYNPACWAAVIAASHDISGNTPPNMPRFSGTFTASYDFNIAGGVFTPEVSFIHHGSQWARIFNEPALDRVKAYDLLNLSATYAMANGHVRISLNATNLANRAAVNNRYTSPYESGLTSVEYVPPRQIIGTIAYQF